VPADCQIDGCGVLAIGRCQACERAFCATHQAHDRLGRARYTDLCGACQSNQERAAAQNAKDRWLTFLDTVRACEARPLPRLLAGFVLKDGVDPPQKAPWCLYDPKLAWATFNDPDLCRRIARDFAEEALRRGVQPQGRVRSRHSVKKGFLQRARWEAVYGDGWEIPHGSDRRSGGKGDSHLNAIIWADGEISAERAGEIEPGQLREGALVTMAEILEINTTPGPV
jgi:hypothetical protein